MDVRPDCVGCLVFPPHHNLHRPGQPVDLHEFARRYVGTSGHRATLDPDQLASELTAGQMGFGQAYGGDGYNTQSGRVAVRCHGEVIAVFTTARLARAHLAQSHQLGLFG